MAKIHDLFIVELAEVIKGYGNNPDDKDPFRLSEFYRFYELPNIAVSRENFEKMRPIEPERKTGKWVQRPRYEGDTQPMLECPFCQNQVGWWDLANYCNGCGARLEGGADMRGEQNEDNRDDNHNDNHNNH